MVKNQLLMQRSNLMRPRRNTTSSRTRHRISSSNSSLLLEFQDMQEKEREKLRMPTILQPRMPESQPDTPKTSLERLKEPPLSKQLMTNTMKSSLLPILLLLLLHQRQNQQLRLVQQNPKQLPRPK
jgi:hypothetical protein